MPKKKAQKKIQTAIGSDDPASSVNGFSKLRNINNIVVGTRGLGKFKEILMGSISRKIANNAEANCFIIR